MPFSQMFDFLFGHWKMDVIIALWYKICKNGHVKKTDANICQFKKYSVNIIYRYPKWIAAIPRRGRLNCRNSVFTVWATQGVRWCALQGLEIMQVEILSGKELTNPPEVSFELLLVTAVAKRKQRDSRDSYWAPKYRNTRRAMLLPEQKPTERKEGKGNRRLLIFWVLHTTVRKVRTVNSGWKGKPVRRNLRRNAKKYTKR